jgi:16S rRNA (cytosine1402-N4)-methyltransferase
MYHNPVLLKESIEALNICPGGTYVDVTYGGGGHSNEILKSLNEAGRLLAFDQDLDALENKMDDDRLVLIQQNFRYLINYVKFYNELPVDGILADLGVSSHQFDHADRGFSTRFEGVLDMRMDRDSEVTAESIVNTYEYQDLIDIFRNYGELNNAGRIAEKIINERKVEEITTTHKLKDVLDVVAEKGKENKFYARVFQALRIEVNDEMGALKEMLRQSVEVLKPGGRLVVISYHSLEDRLVKNFMKSGNFEGKIEKDFYGNPQVPFKLISRKPITPNEKEIDENSRARSAKLRIAEKI